MIEYRRMLRHFWFCVAGSVLMLLIGGAGLFRSFGLTSQALSRAPNVSPIYGLTIIILLMIISCGVFLSCDALQQYHCLLQYRRKMLAKMGRNTKIINDYFSKHMAGYSLSWGDIFRIAIPPKALEGLERRRQAIERQTVNYDEAGEIQDQEIQRVRAAEFLAIARKLVCRMKRA